VLLIGPFGAGALAGLGVALPLGAIGVLIVREGVERGPRPAIAAALAVACIDLAYATLAVVLGARVSAALAGYERVIQVVGAGALTVVVVVGVRGTLRAARSPRADLPGAADPLPSRSVFLRFAALTAVNPMTAVYFVALTVGLSAQLTGAGAGSAFAVGVFVGSLAWQLVLAVGGSVAGARMAPSLRVGVSLVGYAIVAMYAVRLAVGG
jgi:arginine exporter protein ArgO